MRHRFFAVLLLLTFSLSAVAQKVHVPTTKKVDHTDDYFGTKVADPYRWLEDDNSAETKAWVEEENKATFDYLNTIPERKWIQNRLTTLWNYERYGTPNKEGKYYFFTKNNGLQNQNVLYVSESLTAEPRMLLDPNTLSADGTVALSGTTHSRDGKLLAYGVSASGSDWQEWFVRDVATGKDLSDHLTNIKFSNASFNGDGSGFYYGQYPKPDEKTKMMASNEGQMIYFHKIGTPQSDDKLIYSRPEQPKSTIGSSVTDDGNYLYLLPREGTDRRNRFYYFDLNRKGFQLVKLIDTPDASYSLIDNDGTVFYFRTDLDAPNSRVIAIDLNKPERANWKTIIPEAPESMGGVNIVDHKFVVSYLKDAHTQVKVFGMDGKFIRDVTLPGIGTANGFNGHAKDTETFYNFASFTTPGVIYRYDMKTGKSDVYRKPKVAFNSDDYETQEVFYPSKDGTKIPMFLSYKKGLKLNGQNPTLLYAYGGFNISTTPNFTVYNLVWMDMGGVYASACLRGGSEYGEKWHEAGTKMHKQNVFDDFISAAEWLIAQKYTSTPKLAIYGRSNGGLLVGAALTQRPELFGATLPAVGVMDMLRFHKFTIGWAWASDYGNSEQSDEMFKYIYHYSPLHNLKPGVKYPPSLVSTADHDDRVVPAHSFKFAATMQADQGGDAPVLIRIETKAGHGGGMPVSKQIELYTDQWGFLVKNLHMTVPSN